MTADPAARSGAPPSLLDGPMAVALFALTAYGMAGLALAVVGVAHPIAVLGLGSALFVGSLRAWRPGRAERSTGAERIMVAAAVGLAVVSGGYNAVKHGEYVVTDRDPGIYVTGGKWIAEDGDLVVEALGGGLDGVDGVETWAAGYSGDGATDDEVQIQGAHLFHTTLAMGDWLGGNTGLFVVPAVIGALGLMVFFWLARMVVPSWLALVAEAALAVNFAWIYTVRSVLSEPLLLVFSFGGVGLLLVALRSRHPLRYFLAGSVVAASLMVRVDAGVVLMALPVTAAWLISSTDARDRRDSRCFWAWSAGWIAPALVAAADLALRSPNYLGDLGSEVTLVVAGLSVSFLAGAAMTLGWSRLRHQAQRVAAWVRSARWLPWVAAGCVVAVSFGVWFVRPHLGSVRGDRPGEGWRIMEDIQRNEGLDPDGRRTYAERSLDRVRWYTGEVAVVAAVAGLAVATARLVAGRLGNRLLAVVALVMPCLVLYLYRPSIYSDHPWMIRRYVPTAIPGIILLCVVALAFLVGSRLRSAGWGRVGGVAAGVLAVAVVVQPLLLTWPLRAATWQAGGSAGIERLCDELGDDATALLLQEGNVALTLLPAVRSFCGIPAAGLSANLDVDQGRRAVEQVRAQADDVDRRLVVVAPSRELLESTGAGGFEPVTILQTSRVGTTIARPPGDFADHTLTVWVGEVE